MDTDPAAPAGPNPVAAEEAYRILIVDDNESIHDDFEAGSLSLFFDLENFELIDIPDDVTRDVSDYLVKIQSAILAGHEVELKSIAHGMRGMVANIGCRGMAAVLNDLEFSDAPPPGSANAVRLRIESIWQESISSIIDWVEHHTGLHYRSLFKGGRLIE